MTFDLARWVGRRLHNVAYAKTSAVLGAVLLLLAAWRGPTLLTGPGLGGALTTAAPLILASMSLTVVALGSRGDVNLAVGPLMGFINVVLIHFFIGRGINAPGKIIAIAVILGALVQGLLGWTSVLLRVEPIIVALGGYLALAGLTLVVLPRPGGQVPEWLSSWGAGTSLLSPPILIVGCCCIFWMLLARTSTMFHLRMVGFDERAAFVSGVTTGGFRVLAHALGGALAGLAGLCLTALIGSGDPNQGTNYTLMAITAMVLGGVALTGGAGGMLGAVLGAVDLMLISYVLATFQLGSLAAYANQLVFGLILVLATQFSSVRRQRRRRSESPLVSPEVAEVKDVEHA